MTTRRQFLGSVPAAGAAFAVGSGSAALCCWYWPCAGFMSTAALGGEAEPYQAAQIALPWLVWGDLSRN
jgi:hypothetical protein